jgi:hypothetical protein
MPAATLTFSPSVQINSSLQIGDKVYYAANAVLPSGNIPTNQTNSTTTTGGITYFGLVSDITSTNIQVIHDAGISLPLSSDFIMFEKDKRVNSSSLIGYYADVKLVNNSKEKIELFSLGSEISESSK